MKGCLASDWVMGRSHHIREAKGVMPGPVKHLPYVVNLYLGHWSVGALQGLGHHLGSGLPSVGAAYRERGMPTSL